MISIELQKKSWLDKNNKNQHWSFTEFMYCYFDDLVIDDNYKNKINESWISIKKYNAIRDWHKLFDIYNSPINEDHNNKAILEDEKWKEVAKKGVEAKEKLKKTLIKKEVSILTKEIDYSQFR